MNNTKEMSIELVKSLIATASDRHQGLALRVIRVCGQPTDGHVTLKNTKPGVVNFLADGRVGFNTSGASYITESENSGSKFVAWLQTVNEKAPKGGDYGQPPLGCNFYRCS